MIVGVIVGVLVEVEVTVDVGVLVTVGVSVGKGVLVMVGVFVGVGGIEVTSHPSGVLIARTARKDSTYPMRYDARWIMDGSTPKAGMTMNRKL